LSEQDPDRRDGSSWRLDFFGWRAVFVLAYVIALSVSLYLGFLAPDSLGYLRIAQSIAEGHGCSLHGHYSSVWPCGYPTVISVFGFGVDDYISLIFASKVANFFLIIAGMLMLNSVIRDYRIVLAATLNPIVWGLTVWTISENLFLFATFGVVAATKKLGDTLSYAPPQFIRIVSWSAVIFCFVVIGFLARYFFATFAVALFGATLLVYGRRTALAAIPAYILAAVLFLLLMSYNSREAGFATGMPRMPAQESVRFLLFYFFYRLIFVSAIFIPVFLILWPERFLLSPRARQSDALDIAAAPSPLGYFLIISGAGYLALQFLTRFFFAFDLFSIRLLGPGVALLISGLAIAALGDDPRENSSAWLTPSSKALLLAAYCIVASQGLVPFGRIFLDWRSGHTVSARALILNSKAPPTDAKVIFSFFRPPPTPALTAVDEFYYGKDKTIIYPDHAPEASPETGESYRAQLQKYAGDDCVLDFTQLRSGDELDKALSSTDYDVDVYLSGLKVVRVKRPGFDPSLKEFLARAFKPGQYAPCKEALAVNPIP
jgi:hypothetical protein